MKSNSTELLKSFSLSKMLFHKLIVSSIYLYAHIKKITERRITFKLWMLEAGKLKYAKA